MELEEGENDLSQGRVQKIVAIIHLGSSSE